MDLRLLTSFTLPSVNKTNFNFNFNLNSLAFKGLKEDTFERQTQTPLSQREQVDQIIAYDKEIEALKAELEEIKKERAALVRQKNYEKNRERLNELYDLKEEKSEQIKATKVAREKLIAKLNPNIAFMSDENLSWPKRREILAQHPEIIALSDIQRAQQDCCFKNLYYDSPYFIPNRTNIGVFIDTSYLPNVANYATLQREGLKSYSEFCEEYGFDMQEVNRYVREGLIEPITLTNLETDEEERVHIIDTQNPDTIADGIKRHNDIQNALPVRSKYADNKYVSANYLSRLGFGCVEDIEKAIQYKQLKGQYFEVEGKNGKVKMPYVNIQHPGAEGYLHYLRNQDKSIVDINSFNKLAKVDMTDIEDAILSGEVECIPEYIFKGDKDKFVFNLKNPKNVRFIEKKQFEAELIRLELKKDRREKNSLRAKIAWALCPETKTVAKKIVALNPELIDVFKKKDEIKDFRERKEKGLTEPDEQEPYLTRHERILIKMFYKQMWNEAGTDEYNAALKQAKAAIVAYRARGLEAISDDRIKAVITEFYAKDDDN